MAKIGVKQVQVAELKEKLEKASSAVLVDARGLTVEQDTRLRRDLREAGVEYKVYKNTIMKFAFEDTHFSDLEPFLSGPSTLALSYEDSTVAARIISSHLKEMKVMEFKAGHIEGKLYDAQTMKAVGNIPAQDVLYGKLLGSFKSPMAKFARLINAIAEDKAGNAQEA